MACVTSLSVLPKFTVIVIFGKLEQAIMLATVFLHAGMPELQGLTLRVRNLCTACIQVERAIDGLQATPQQPRLKK